MDLCRKRSRPKKQTKGMRPKWLYSSEFTRERVAVLLHGWRILLTAVQGFLLKVHYFVLVQKTILDGCTTRCKKWAACSFRMIGQKTFFILLSVSRHAMDLQTKFNMHVSAEPKACKEWQAYAFSVSIVFLAHTRATTGQHDGTATLKFPKAFRFKWQKCLHCWFDALACFTLQPGQFDSFHSQ